MERTRPWSPPNLSSLTVITREAAFPQRRMNPGLVEACGFRRGGTSLAQTLQFWMVQNSCCTAHLPHRHPRDGCSQLPASSTGQQKRSCTDRDSSALQSPLQAKDWLQQVHQCHREQQLPLRLPLQKNHRQ